MEALGTARHKKNSICSCAAAVATHSSQPGLGRSGTCFKFVGGGGFGGGHVFVCIHSLGEVGGFKIFFMFIPNFGEDEPILTTIFQIGLESTN